MLASVSVDFEITQLLDGTKGVHGMIPKSMQEIDAASALCYLPTKCGASFSFSQRCSMSSVSGSKTKCMVVDFHGFVYAFGSSTVTSNSMFP